MTCLTEGYSSLRGTLESTLENCSSCSHNHQNERFSGEHFMPKILPQNRISLYQKNDPLQKSFHGIGEHCNCDCHQLKTGTVEAPKLDIPQSYALRLVPIYDKSFADIVQKYFESDAKKQLTDRLTKEGRTFYNLTCIGTSDLGGAVAAVAMKDEDAVLLGNREFSQKIEQFSRFYNVPKDIATRYVLDHEFVHISQKGKYFDSTVETELDVEHTLQKHYKELAIRDPEKKETYAALGSIAENRERAVAFNYGKHTVRSYN